MNDQVCDFLSFSFRVYCFPCLLFTFREIENIFSASLFSSNINTREGRGNRPVFLEHISFVQTSTLVSVAQ